MSVHAGHVDIRDQDRNVLLARQFFQGFIAAVCACDLATDVFEHAGDHGEHGGIIIND
jgi:hypothetical protein